MVNKIWLEEFGNEYVTRNPVNEESVEARIGFFAGVLNAIRTTSLRDFPKSILEVGAGQGQNLIALHTLSELGNWKVDLWGCEPNDKARAILKVNCPHATISSSCLPNLGYEDYSKELVFTSGVLIHVPTDELILSMRELYRVSSRYILVMEYFSPVERKIHYHGNDEALWLRDYGGLLLDNFKLKCLTFGFCWDRVTKMGDITYWLMEKVN